MINWLLQPWPWWVSGILIGIMPLLLFWSAGKAFGISTSLQHIGSICTPNSSLDYLRKNDWRKEIWNLIFVAGLFVGGFVAAQFLSAEPPKILPPELFSGVGGFIRLAVGGLLVGFGTRYAGGCTSGHTITGISTLNLPSLIATAAFFVGGLVMTWGFGWLVF